MTAHSEFSFLRLIISLGLLIILASWNGADAKRIDVKSVDSRITISGYAQTLYQATDEKDALPTNTFRIRRARFQLAGEISDQLSARLSVGLFTDRVEARSVYLTYTPNSELTLKMGQIKKPFSLSRLRAARNQLMVDRPKHVRQEFAEYLGRDVGIVAELRPDKRVRLTAGVFNGNGIGEGAAQDNNDSKDIACRLEIVPLKGMELGANVSRQGRADLVQESTLWAYGLDADITHAGWHLATEGLWGEKRDFNTQHQMFGLYVTLVHTWELDSATLDALEIGGRIEFFDFDRDADDDASTILVPHLGVYLHANVRLQTNLLYQLPQHGDRALELLTQAQIEF